MHPAPLIILYPKTSSYVWVKGVYFSSPLNPKAVFLSGSESDLKENIAAFDADFSTYTFVLCGAIAQTTAYFTDQKTGLSWRKNLLQNANMTQLVQSAASA